MREMIVALFPAPCTLDPRTLACKTSEVICKQIKDVHVSVSLILALLRHGGLAFGHYRDACAHLADTDYNALRVTSFGSLRIDVP